MRPFDATPIATADRRAVRYLQRAARDGEAPDRREAACDFYQAGRASAGLISERPRGLCAERHGR